MSRTESCNIELDSSWQTAKLLRARQVINKRKVDYKYTAKLFWMDDIIAEGTDPSVEVVQTAEVILLWHTEINFV